MNFVVRPAATLAFAQAMTYWMTHGVLHTLICLRARLACKLSSRVFLTGEVGGVEFCLAMGSCGGGCRAGTFTVARGEVSRPAYKHPECNDTLVK